MSRKFLYALERILFSLASAMRTGAAFTPALEAITKRSRGNALLTTALEETLRRLHLGEPAEEALESLSRAAPCEETLWLARAVGIARRSGGPMSDVLEEIAEMLRARRLFRQKLETLTAQSRLSGKVVGALPILLIACLTMIAPDFTAPLFQSSLGRAILALILILIAAGWWMIQRIMKIEI